MSMFSVVFFFLFLFFFFFLDIICFIYINTIFKSYHKRKNSYNYYIIFLELNNN
uniref:Hypothetical secreted peptide n=1 Tax=Glossina morsitans morsitans TaxID=37546 RepID=D3TSG5_GLOMM